MNKIATKLVVGWHHWLNGHESEQAPGFGDGQQAWHAAFHGVTKRQTWLRDWTDLKYKVIRKKKKKSKWRTLQNETIIFKSIKIITDYKIVRNCHNLEKLKEAHWLNVSWDEKRSLNKNKGILIKFELLVNRIVSVLFYWLPKWLSGTESACQCRRCKRCGLDPWVGKIPWSWKW